jgi:hypothetical protein
MNAQRPSPNPGKTGHPAVKILETERLILRLLTTDDADFMLELMNEPAFLRNVAERGLRPRADAEGYIVEKILPS